jgi:Flp pilus assembly CpaE family ATPase
VADRVRLVLNHSGTEETEISRKKAEETLKMEIAWQIPHAAKVFQAARIKGALVEEVAKGSRPHQSFLEMARAYQPEPEPEVRKPKRGLFAALF